MADSAYKTVNEIARVLKPGGLLFATQAFAKNSFVSSIAYLA